MNSVCVLRWQRVVRWTDMAWMKVTTTLQGNENPAAFLLALLWTPLMRLAVVATVMVRVPKSPETFTQLIRCVFIVYLFQSFTFRNYLPGKNFENYKHFIQETLQPGCGVYPHVVQIELDKQIKKNFWEKTELTYPKGNDHACTLLVYLPYRLSKFFIFFYFFLYFW